MPPSALRCASNFCLGHVQNRDKTFALPYTCNNDLCVWQSGLLSETPARAGERVKQLLQRGCEFAKAVSSSPK